MYSWAKTYNPQSDKPRRPCCHHTPIHAIPKSRLKFLLLYLLRTRRQPRLDQQTRHHAQSQNQERTRAHRPTKARIGDHLPHDQREEDAAQSCTGGGEADGDAALLAEPGHGAGQRRIQEHGGADAGAEALGEDELVVLV